MTKNQFIKILHKYSGSTSSEASNVIALKETYPYSQVLHALSARLSSDHKFPSQQYELQMAAVYAADRAVLKDVMEKKAEAWPTSNEVAGIKHPATPESIVTRIDHKDSANDLAEELMQDLHRLSELKDNFEKMFVDGKLNKAIPVANISRKAEPIVESEAPTDEPKTETKPTPPKRKKSSGKTRAQRIVELAKKLEEEEAAAQEDILKNEGETEDIIQQIKSSKKKIEPETEKQREQLDLINQFIKTQPKITGLKDRDLTAQNDLSTINNGEFGDHVISETLVDILLKQGKKDKAIEVLKKLIWKFPQKKGYFAAQIEELKK